MFRSLPSLLVLFFMTNALGVPPALAGVSVFVPKPVCPASAAPGVLFAYVMAPDLLSATAAAVHAKWGR